MEMKLVNSKEKSMRLIAPEKITVKNCLPEIIVFSELNFKGVELRTNLDADFVGVILNDDIKSIIVVSGEWEFFVHAGCHKKDSLGTLPIGYYSDVTLTTLKDEGKGISSFKSI